MTAKVEKKNVLIRFITLIPSSYISLYEIVKDKLQGYIRFWEKEPVDAFKLHAVAVFIPFMVWVLWPKALPQETINLLEEKGFVNVEIYGSTAAGCGRRGDVWRTAFSAQNMKGQTVSGIACKSLFSDTDVIKFD